MEELPSRESNLGFPLPLRTECQVVAVFDCPYRRPDPDLPGRSGLDVEQLFRTSGYPRRRNQLPACSGVNPGHVFHQLW